MHPQYKVVCIGDIGVGKTSILGRCRNSSFHDLTATTIACDVIIVKFEFKSESVSLCLWDTAGTERYSSLNSNYFKNSLGAMVIVSA